MSTSLKLEDDQRFALMKFRRAVQDILQPHQDDHFLLRWLRARKWDPAAAEKMLRDSVEWRRLWDADKIFEWKPPKILEDFLPHGTVGLDKDGAPVVVAYFSNLDLYGILHVVTRTELIKAVILHLERLLTTCREQAQKHGPAAGQITIIFDMDDFSLKQYLWRPAGETVINMIQMYEANYPEILKICYIINAPKVFAFAFSIAKKFLNEYTLSKIQIYKADPPKWKTAILNTIPKDSLPVYLGGTLQDPDGNPRLFTKINRAGKVPKELYLENTEREKNMEDFVTTTIRKGSKLELDISAAELGSLLSWDFRTEGHDIKFGIFKKESGGSAKEIVPLRRVAAHQIDEVGILNCEVPATYSVIFDNSYSLLRNKKIHYCVRLLPPASQELVPDSS